MFVNANAEHDREAGYGDSPETRKGEELENARTTHHACLCSCNPSVPGKCLALGQPSLTLPRWAGRNFPRCNQERFHNQGCGPWVLGIIWSADKVPTMGSAQRRVLCPLGGRVRLAEVGWPHEST